MIRLIELFGGIGAQAQALENLGIPFEHYRLVEYDKYPVKSYNAIHGTNFEPMDIRNVHGPDLGIVDTYIHTYILTYSFPCQDLSVAGKQKGMSKGSGTRSGLLWEVERLLNETEELPQILLMENVPQVHSEQNIGDFADWLDFLASKGYFNYYEDLNAKDFGIPQNRERCFCVSMLNPMFYVFPFPTGTDKKLKDVLEDEVEPKYYIKGEKVRKLISDLVLSGRLLSKQASKHVTYRQTIRESSSEQIVSKHDMTQESPVCKQMELASLKQYATEFERFTNESLTIMARDFKGFGKQGMTGVIEWEIK